MDGKLTRRTSVTNVEMQGSVWGSLKCTVSMDMLNKTILKQDHLTYQYRSDPNIRIGVLGMVDDNLSISKCGIPSVQKNAVINSFIDTQRLTLSKNKSVVLHIGNEKKCPNPCPKLKVHSHIMKTTKSQRYLGDIITSSGTVRESIQDRRNKGWGRVAEISGILGQLPDMRKVEIGLKLRDSKLINGMIYSTESWSKIPDIEMVRLEQVDMAVLRNIVDAHSKCSKAFLLLEYGVLSFSHLIMIRRMMYHHHIINRDTNELIKKIYMKQKEDTFKGDWYETLMTDFAFIKEEIDDESISKIPKEQYQKTIKEKVEKEAFSWYLKLKEKSKKKMGDFKYTKLAIQPYLTNDQFSLNQIKLLFALRSKCYPAKLNFRKLNRGNLRCRMGCNEEESQ